MPVLDSCLAALLALWAIGSVLFLARVPMPGRWLARLARWGWFVRWGVFSVQDPSRRAGTFELVVCDRTAAETAPVGRTVASGHCWSWRAFLWLPERHLASALQNLGRQARRALDQAPEPEASIARRARLLGRYAARLQPAPAGTHREIRLRRVFPGSGAEPEVVLTIPPSALADGN